MYVIFDIGGTKTLIGVTYDKITFESAVLPTNLDFKRALLEIKETVQKLSKGAKIEGVVGGVRALDKDKGVLHDQPHFPLWVDKPLRAELVNMFNAPVWLENDAALAGLGEALAGAGRGYKVVVYITVSTGIGGVRIVNGKIDSGDKKFVEIIKIITPNNNEPQHLESYVSGTAIEASYGVKAENLKDSKAWIEITNSLAIGLNNVIVQWSPDIIVLGGGVMNSPYLTISNISSALQTMFPASQKTTVAKSVLGDLAGLYGALEIIKHQTI